MKVHIRTHTNIRPYHCTFKNICNQSFKTKSQLHDHILKHTQIKKYSCPNCNVSFARKSRLKIHMMIHKGLKPFQCYICKKKFREKSNYNFHLKNHIKKFEKSKFEFEANKNEINKSYTNEIDFKGIETINIGNIFNDNKTFFKDQDIKIKSNNNNIKNNGNEIINNNNQIEVKNIKISNDNDELKILEKDEFLINLNNIFNQIDPDIICIDEQKKSTDETSFLFNDNNNVQKYNIYEQNNIDNTLNSINNEDFYLSNLNNANKLGLMLQNNNIEFKIKNKLDDFTCLLGFP